MTPTPSAVDVKQFIDQRPLAPRQWLLVFLCFLVVAADGIDVAIMGFLAPAIVQEWGISKAAFGWVMSAAPFGLVIGALVAGPSSDRYGRKTVLTTAVAVFGAFTLIAAHATTAVELGALRLLAGVGLGAAMPNTTTLLSEYVPEQRRGSLITLMFTGFAVGSAGVGFAAAWLIPHYGWRMVLTLGGALPVLLVPVLMIWLPESARYLVVRQRPAERIARVLGRVCGTRFAAGTTFHAPEPAVQQKKPIGTLFSQGYAPVTFSLWATYFMGLLVIYLLTGWLPTMIKDAGLPISQAATITALFQTGGIVGAILTGRAMDRMNPTRVIALAYAAGALCVLGVGLVGPLSTAMPLWVLAAGFFMNGAQTGLNAHAPGCYPTAARATGVSWMLGMGRFGSILGSGIGGWLVAFGWGFGPVIASLTVPALLAGVAILASHRAARRATAASGALSASRA